MREKSYASLMAAAPNNYSQRNCENAASEGVADRYEFKCGDVNKLDSPDKSFSAVTINCVCHNIRYAQAIAGEPAGT